MMMVSNYVKVALRNLMRRKGFSFITIAGLSLGLTCCLLILQYVDRELSFDRFNENFQDLYRVTETSSRTGETGALEGYALGPALGEEVPEVVRFARVHPDYDNPVISPVSEPGKSFEEKRVFYADPAFLKMFSYPLVAGNADLALAEPGTILISQSSARKYFGSLEPMGQTLSFTGWIEGVFRVNGVFKDVPPNSHLQFDFLLPMVSLLQNSDYKDPKQAWPWSNFLTYVQLRHGANSADVEEKFTNVVMAHRKADFERTKSSVRMHAQPLSDVHLNSAVSAPRTRMGSYRSVNFFVMIGIVTFLIALVNYVNLATARSAERTREVGIRKVVGAQRRQIMFQFLLESAITNMAAMTIALAGAELLKPTLETLAGVKLSWGTESGALLLIAAGAFFCLGTLLAGLYPAFVLSSVRIVTVLKGKMGSLSMRHRLRQALVLAQFAASIVLLVGTAIVYSQLQFVRRMDLGIKLDRILTIRGPSVVPKGSSNIEVVNTLLQRLREIPSIEQIATSSALPGDGFNWYTSNLRRATAEPSTGIRGALARVDTGFARLFGLQVIAGSGFEGMTPPMKEVQPLPVIATQTAVEALGFDTPQQSLNQRIAMGGTDCLIIGVFKEFNWSSAHSKRENAIFALTPVSNRISMKVNSADLSETIAAVRNIYTTLLPGNPFDYYFVDDRFNEQYRDDQRFGDLFAVFAGLAILIASLGLFGLSAFTTEQRTKEIGIRKVLGASATSVVSLVTREFVVLVILANVVAWPVAYYLMHQWLQSFAYHVTPGIWSFVLSGILALLTACLSVASQAIRAARANPVEALRYE
jgi:putative ABC transport system permease protein